MLRILIILILGTSSVVLSAQSTKENDAVPTRAEMMIYPNPAFDMITISFSEIAEQIFIYNLIGKKVKTHEIQGKEEHINISDLNTGIYIAQLIGKNNKVLATQRIQKR